MTDWLITVGLGWVIAVIVTVGAWQWRRRQHRSLPDVETTDRR